MNLPALLPFVILAVPVSFALGTSQHFPSERRCRFYTDLFEFGRQFQYFASIVFAVPANRRGKWGKSCRNDFSANRSNENDCADNMPRLKLRMTPVRRH